MDERLLREVRILRAWVAVLTLAGLAVLVTAVRRAPDEKTKFGEIDVERINVVEADGQLRMVISNRARQHPGVVDGVMVPRPNGRPPGMLFFDHLGNECGGLVYDENGGQGHFVSLTFDKSRQDQTIGLQHLEGDDGSYFAGLFVWDRPDTPLSEILQHPDRFQREDIAGAQRIAIGKNRDRSCLIQLADPEGRPRLRIQVDPDGNPHLDFLDEDGETLLTLPDDV